MFANREAYVAGTMGAIRKGLPICNKWIDLKKMTKCKVKLSKKSVKIESEDKSISLSFSNDSDLFKCLTKYPDADIALDNLYYKDTEKILEFVKTSSRADEEGEDGFNEKHTEEMYNELVDYYMCMDETYTDDVERRVGYYVVVNIFVFTSKEYYITDGMYGRNSCCSRQLFRLSDGKQIWNPFFYSINYSELNFGGPWD